MRKRIMSSGITWWKARKYQGRPNSQRVSCGISSTLPENNYIEDLFYRFPQNKLPRNAFHGMSLQETQERHKNNDEEKSNKTSATHYFLGEYCITKSHLISQRTSSRKIQVFKWFLIPPTQNRIAFVLPSLNTVHIWLNGNRQKGGAWSIFGNTEMYHLCVQ